MKVHVELPSRQLKVCLRCLRYEKGRLFSSEVFLDEFTDLAIIYLDLKCLHILEIVMENSYTLILMRLKGENVIF